MQTTVLQRQIKSTGLTVEQVADYASVPLNLLKRAVAGELYLDQPEEEQVNGLIWWARVLLAKYAAEQAGVEFDQTKAEDEAMQQRLVDLKDQTAELHAEIVRLKAIAFARWIREEDLEISKTADWDAVYAIFDSVQKANG
jgi:hypothetical protein